MASTHAPKQWSLFKDERITSFEAWRQNLLYILSLDPNFAHFLLEGTTWQRKTSNQPTRGFADDGEDVPQANRRSAAQKVTHLELIIMLGQIANFGPVVVRNTIVKNSTSMQSICQAIRAHFGFQATGARFLDFNNLHLEPGERPEDLHQRLLGFMDDNLLKANGSIRHHGENVTKDEELTPTLQNVIVITWVRLVHPDLPALIKQLYGTELRSQTLASLKPEISQALESLLEEIQSTSESKVLRTAFQQSSSQRNAHPQTPPNTRVPGTRRKICPLVSKQTDHSFTITLASVPTPDRQYLTRARQVMSESLDIETASDYIEEILLKALWEVAPITTELRLQRDGSVPIALLTLRFFYHHHALQLTLDTGSEISMIKVSGARQVGAIIHKTRQTALQAHGITPFTVVGEVHFNVNRDHVDLHLAPRGRGTRC